MKILYSEQQRRYAEFPAPIRMLGYNNPVVKSVMDRYATGDIVTYDEALCQMIILLSANWDEKTRRLFEIHQSMKFVPRKN